MELPTKNKERRRGKADKAEGIGERGSTRGRKERRKEGPKRRKKIKVRFPWVSSHMIHFSYPTQALLLRKDPTAEPSQLNLVSG